MRCLTSFFHPQYNTVQIDDDHPAIFLLAFPIFADVNGVDAGTARFPSATFVFSHDNYVCINGIWQHSRPINLRALPRPASYCYLGLIYMPIWLLANNFAVARRRGLYCARYSWLSKFWKNRISCDINFNGLNHFSMVTVYKIRLIYIYMKFLILKLNWLSNLYEILSVDEGRNYVNDAAKYRWLWKKKKLCLQIMVLKGLTVVLMWCLRIPCELVVRTCGGKTFAPAWRIALLDLAQLPRSWIAWMFPY